MKQSRLRSKADRVLAQLVVVSRQTGDRRDAENCVYLEQCIVLYDMARKTRQLSDKANNQFLRNAIRRVEQ